MIILVMGVTGCGKTTIGSLLAAGLHWPFIDADEFHPPANVSKMASGTPLDDEDRGPWLAALKALISHHNSRGDDAVLACSALKHSYRQTLASAAPLRVVYLKADPELIRARVGHRTGHFMPPGLVESQFSDLEEPQAALTIPAEWSPGEIVQAIQSHFGLTSLDA